jgi:hypothetical protein
VPVLVSARAIASYQQSTVGRALAPDGEQRRQPDAGDDGGSRHCHTPITAVFHARFRASAVLSWSHQQVGFAMRRDVHQRGVEPDYATNRE